MATAPSKVKLRIHLRPPGVPRQWRVVVVMTGRVVRFRRPRAFTAVEVGKFCEFGHMTPAAGGAEPRDAVDATVVGCGVSAKAFGRYVAARTW